MQFFQTSIHVWITHSPNSTMFQDRHQNIIRPKAIWTWESQEE
jgi:hypothetical protein